MGLLRVNPGFDASNVLTFRVDLPGPGYSAQRCIEFYRQLLSDIQAVPGVQSASAIEPLPIGDGNMACSFQIEGRPTPPGEYFNTDFRSIALHYFATMRIPLLNGRDFTARDDLQAMPVVIINQSLARRFFPDQNPIGKRITPATSNGYPQAPLRTIVGVVADVRSRALMETARPEVYVPQAQSAMIMTAVVRSNREPHVLIPYIRSAVGRLDKNLPVYNVFPLSAYLSGSLAGPRWNALLLGIFASLGLTLAAVGLYGITSYFVAQRRHEVGIRMALGAQHSQVLRMVVREAMVLVGLGAGLGLLGAVALTRLLSHMLYGIKSLDPLTFISVSVLLAAVGALASYLPAHRASRIDPMLALRHE
jgi:putative ABC transport system permease protein